jgi:hypothetical protein
MTPIIARDFDCSLAQSVTVRNTPQVHCRDDAALGLCQQLYERLKVAGLEAFDMADDLTTTPQSVYLKIQCGGLLQLQVIHGDAEPQAGGIADVRALVAGVTADGSLLDDLPYEELAAAMTRYRAKRRRERR